MKKRTKQKLVRAAGKSVQGLFKLIFIYPFKAAWFVSKHGYYAVRDSRMKNKKEPVESSTIVKNVKTIKRGDELSLPAPQPGKIKNEPRPAALEEIKHKTGKFESFQKKLYHNKSTIGLILGARGTGKSALGMRLLENFKLQTDKKVYALGFKAKALPGWITVIHDIHDIENNSVILIDEGGIEFSSRKTMSDANTLLSEILLIARHKDLSVIFIAQNSANLEINVIRQADYLLLKPSSLLQKDFERKKIKDIYVQAEDDFEELKDNIGLTYIYADNYRGFVNNGLPGFWSEDVSKGYAHK
ncbi:hypothetical protein COV20_02390 [Candidatus Woesearchaeota archaeon CG10_big_fil_rev_8_21_14_0_10_45_16]|nr:MAG: hypothetical protein COV20_02390 [Candidatus Woesearchaeota archaeon CG10_big_fil_rev_8_21_14_0_10_45_16]